MRNEFGTDKTISAILGSIESDAPCVQGTLLYNEGWMLRLVLASAAAGIDCLPFRCEPQSRWYSEAWLRSAFLPRFRGDRLAESMTHADGVVGHFNFDPLTKSGLRLLDNATQFVVCEAKLGSSLSAGTRNASQFDQAARNVACMAETLRRAERPLTAYRSLGFYVIAPEAQIAAGVFGNLVSQVNIEKAIFQRIEMYSGQPEHQRHLQWYEMWALPLIKTMSLGCLSWESIITRVKQVSPEQGQELEVFYVRCMKHNSLAARAAGA